MKATITNEKQELYHFNKLALKDPTSYLLIIYGVKLELVEKGQKMYSTKFSLMINSPFDAVYAEHLNAYLIIYKDMVIRKDIDSRVPWIWMRIGSNFGHDGILLYSKIQKRLILLTDDKNLIVLNLDKRKRELEVRRTKGDNIMQMRVFGKEEKKLIYLSYNGSVVWYSFNFGMRKVCSVNSARIKLNKVRKEFGASLAVSDLSDYLLVEVGGFQTFRGSLDRFICSRMILFSIKNSKLVTQSIFDRYSEKIGCCWGALDCAGYFGKQLAWVGLDLKNGIIEVYGIDQKTKRFKEVKRRKELVNEEKMNGSLHRFGRQFFFISLSASILRLELEF